MSQEFIKGVSEEYKKVLTEFLFRLFRKRSGIKDEILPKYINEETIYKFALALTHKSYDKRNNYEYYETLGDATLNKCTVWYFHNRFPELKSKPNANERMSLLKTQNVSKMSFADLSKKLGMDYVIRFHPTYKDGDKEKYVVVDNKLRTDVFESLMGCIEDILDETEHLMGVGASVVYNIFASLMDQIPFSIEMESIRDPKTTLLQLFVKMRPSEVKIESIQQTEIKQVQNMDGTVSSVPDRNNFIATIKYTLRPPYAKKEIYREYKSKESAKNKLHAEKELSKLVLEQLKKEFNISYDMLE